MANIPFSGHSYDDAGAALVGATINLYDSGTVTPVRATTTTDANGYWTISHATQGLFDVETVYGTSKRRRKYADEIQVKGIEVADFSIRNPADTFAYSIVPGAITAARIVTIPLIAQDITLGPVMAAKNATGESTTQTTPQTTIITLSSLAIPIGSHVIVEAAVRKTTGHASAAFIGLKLNATQVRDDVQFTTAGNAAESGHFRAEFTMGVTNFLLSGFIQVGTDQQAYAITTFGANMPAATLTDVIITGHVDNALNTLLINWIRVYHEP